MRGWPLAIRSHKSEMLADDVAGITGKEPPCRAAAAQGGHRHVRMIGGEIAGEGQGEEHPERRAARRLAVQQPGEEHRLGGGLRPPHRIALTDQPGEIERLGGDCDRCFHAIFVRELRAARRAQSKTTTSERVVIGSNRCRVDLAQIELRSSAPQGLGINHFNPTGNQHSFNILR